MRPDDGSVDTDRARLPEESTAMTDTTRALTSTGPSMSELTTVAGVVFAAIGVISYVGSGLASPTAFIPTGFGVVFIVLGVVARNEAWRQHVMHAAAVLAVLAILGSLNGLADLPDLVTGEPLDRPWAVGAKSAFVVAAAIYLFFSIRSFVRARSTRASAR